MIIAVNTRLNNKTQPPGYADFLLPLLQELCSLYPQHRFILISDSPLPEHTGFPENVTFVAAGPRITGKLKLQYWFNFRVPALLRRYKADVFVSPEGICSLRTKTPQCLIIINPGLLYPPLQLKKSVAGSLVKATSRYISKAAVLATVPGIAREVIAEKFQCPAADILVIPPVTDKIFIPLGWQEAEHIREKYTAGKAYFLFSGHITGRENMINLLKAFTFFKKRQKSNMLLMLAGNADEAFKKELKTYKLRNEVILLENPNKAVLAQVTAAAYALVNPAVHDALAIAALQAMQCRVPVITSADAALPDVFGEAALLVNPAIPEDIAEKMMQVFKDEDKAKAMVEAGTGLLKRFGDANAASLLMQGISKAVDQAPKN